MIKLAQFW